MKKLLTISFLLLLFFESKSQSRFPLKENSNWTMFFKEASYQCEPQIQDEYYSMYFNGDTIINGLWYFKLYKSGTAHYDEPFVYKDIYAGALRDAANIFYFVGKNKSEEIVLYDFTKNISDTIYTGINQQLSIIYDIDTLDNGRKMFLCRSDFQHAGKCNSGYIIEGIGGTGGLLYDMPCVHPGLREHFLICYSEGNLSKYKSFLTNCPCNLETTETTVNKSTAVSGICYPNPASEKLIIKKWFSTDSEFYIHDLSGKTIKTGVLTSHSMENVFEVSDLQKGLYILSWKTMGQTLKYKILIK